MHLLLLLLFMQGSRHKTLNRAIRKMPAIDFVEWLVRSVNPEDFVVLKLDIEGAEFEVVKEMVRTR